jgi:hypothetical protein
MIRTLTQFIAKLDRLNYITSDKRKKLFSEEGFEVSYAVELTTPHTHEGKIYFPGDVAARLVVRVVKDNRVISFWGCEHEKDNQELVTWFLGKYNEVEKAEFKAENELNDANQLIWKNL